MKTHTKETQKSLSPADALQFLKEGNVRFSTNLKANRNLLQQMNETRGGQFPFAAILSCVDSRTPAELIFDQGLGDIMSARIAGNVINDDVLGSLEFACKAAGAKVVVVVGHSNCGAINGACDGTELGHLTQLLAKISPAIKAVKDPVDSAARTSANAEFVEAVARENVHHSVKTISERSSVLRAMKATGAIDIVGAMYDVSAGSVEFLPSL